MDIVELLEVNGETQYVAGGGFSGVA